MSHPGGTRSRFIPPQAQGSQATSISSSTNNRVDATFSTTFSTTASPNPNQNTSLVPFSQRLPHQDASHSPRAASDSSGDEIVAQRTRTTEIETLYKAKTSKEKTGQLNVTGLLNHKRSGTKNIDIAPQTANIQEVSDEELEARSPKYTGQKLISRPKALSPTGSPYPMLPSNQLSSSKRTSSRKSFNADVSAQDTLDDVNSSMLRHHSNKSNTAALSSNDEKLKGITAVFNRRHSTAARTTSGRFASPIRNFANIEDGRVSSPHTNQEQPMERPATSIVSRRNRNEVDLEEDELAEEMYRTNHKEPHFSNDQRDKRGEKRVSSSEVEDSYRDGHAGKRARTDAFDDILSPDRISISPELESHVNRQNAPPGPAFLGGAAARDNLPGRDPQLRFFFGQDVDEYISTHMEKYEAARKRWSECSRDEWEKGADELVEKFTQLLDFVKDHVKRKVALYASIHTKIDEHQKIREGTAEMLKEAKRTLVAKTGVVVEDGATGFNL